MKLKTYVINLVIITFLVSCSLPSEQVTPVSPDAVFTQAANTVAAELTRVSMLSSPTPKIPTNTPIPTQTISPTSTYTPFVTITSTPVPCNLARFISDVTFPDNSTIAPSQPFEKIWRIQNIGSCSWNSNYRLIFERQDGMGVASGYSQA